MEPLEVSLFGGFQLHRGEQSVPPVPSRAGRSLFAYLAVDRGVRHPRERIAAEFWPDLSPARARRRLSHTLWQVQDALSELDGGNRYLEVTADTLAFEPDAPATVDVERFEAGLERARARRSQPPARVRDLTDLEATVALYRGEFLAGHPDPWVVAEQHRLHQRYLEALGWLVGIAKGHGAHDDALVYARRLTNEDPLREDGHREVMRLSVLLGRPSEAIRQYERCVEVLAEELGTGPSPATEELHQRIVRRRQVAPAAALPTHAGLPERLPLIGRERERDVAVVLLERVLGGHGGALLVEGDPGIGTSRLLAEVIDDAHWRGFTTAEVVCRRPEGEEPYGLVTRLLDELLTPLRLEQIRHRVPSVALATVAELVPHVARAVPPGTAPLGALRDRDGAQRFRDAFAALFEAVCEVTPLLLVVDGAQWGDIESIGAISATVAATATQRLALVVGYRGDEARSRPDTWTQLRELDRAARPERVRLQPLDTFSTGELVRVVARGHAIDTAAITRLQRETGGNPLFLVETLRSLADADLLASMADDGAQLPVPSGIRELVRERLAGLPAEAREVLDVAAIAGDDIDLDTLASASQLPREAIADAADVLVRRSLLTQGHETLGLNHDQVRRVAVDELDEATRRALHGRVGAALESHRPHAVERLAHHYLEADVPAVAATYLHRAARNATRVHAYATADARYRAAIEQRSRVPATVEARYELLAEHEAVLDVLGERDRQTTTLEELVVLADGDQRRRVEVARRRAMLAGHLGDTDASLRHADDAVEGAGALDDPESLAESLVTRASVLGWDGRLAEAVPLLERAVDSARTAATRLRVLAQLGSTLRELQRYDAAERTLRRALQLAEEEGELREEAAALGVLGSVRMETGDSGTAVELYTRSIDRCETIGFRRLGAIDRVNRGYAYHHLGRVAQALDDYADALRSFVALGDVRGQVIVRLNRAGLRHAVLGDDPGAEQDLAGLLDLAGDTQDGRFAALWYVTTAAISQRRGELAAARRAIDRAVEAADDADDAWIRTQVLERLAAVTAAEGDHEAALRAVRRGIAEAAQHAVSDHLPRLRGLEAELLVALGDLDAADDAIALATAGLHAGVERDYLVHHQRYVVARARGATAAAQAAAQAAETRLGEVLEGLDDRARARAWEVAEHRWIQLAAAGLTSEADGRHIEVATADAPLGRALRPEDRVALLIDVRPPAPMPDDPVLRRRAALLHVLEQFEAADAAPTVRDLASLLEVSTATVRRDLGAVRGEGHGVATRGHRAG